MGEIRLELIGDLRLVAKAEGGDEKLVVELVPARQRDVVRVKAGEVPKDEPPLCSILALEDRLRAEVAVAGARGRHFIEAHRRPKRRCSRSGVTC
jgi:hypothetical protein